MSHQNGYANGVAKNQATVSIRQVAESWNLKEVNENGTVKFIGPSPFPDGQATRDGFALWGSGPHAGMAIDGRGGRLIPSVEIARAYGCKYEEYEGSQTHPSDKKVWKKPKSFDGRSLQERGVSAEAMAFFGIAFKSDDNWGSYAIYPTYHPDGKKARSRRKWRYPEKQYHTHPDNDPRKVDWNPNPKDKERGMPVGYNLQNAKGVSDVWLVNSELAVWLFWQEGLMAICPLGEGRSVESFAKMLSVLAENGTDHLHILLDNDIAGCAGACKANAAAMNVGLIPFVYDLTDSPKMGYDASDLWEFWREGEKTVDFKTLVAGQKQATAATLERWAIGSLKAIEKQQAEDTERLLDREGRAVLKSGFRKCPDCDQSAVMKDRYSEYGEWICLKSAGGCGHKFSADNRQILKYLPEKADIPTAMLELVDGKELFWTDTGNRFIVLEREGRRETMGCRSKEFREWLGGEWQDLTGIVAKPNNIETACVGLSDRARKHGPLRKAWIRSGESAGVIYIDLCNRAGELIEIDADGWRIVTNSPCYFNRPSPMLELPQPKRFDRDPKHREVWNRFYNVTNLGTPENKILATAWMIAAMFPQGTIHIPPLVLHGEKGSAKSFTSRILRDTIDPTTNDMVETLKEERDCVIFAQSRVCCMDNIDKMDDWFSRFLSRMVTGGMHQMRKLFTDDGVHTIEGGQAFIMNGIPASIGQEDFNNRAINLHLPVIEESEFGHIPESEIRAEWEPLRPYVLAALCDAVSTILRHRHRSKEIREGKWISRMAEFHVYMLACEENLPADEGEFQRHYRFNCDSTAAVTMDDFLAQVVADYIIKGNVIDSETSTIVYHKLHEHALTMAFEMGIKNRAEALKFLEKQRFPMNSSWIGRRLREIAPNLRRVTNIECGSGKQTHGCATLSIMRLASD